MILADSSEPDNLIRLIRQAVPVTVTHLNNDGMADYFFGNYEGKRMQFNRVQAGELLGDIDSMEDELRRYYNSADYTFQIIEGIISPIRLVPKEGTTMITGDDTVLNPPSTTPPHSAVPSTRGRREPSIYAYKIDPGGFTRYHAYSIQVSILYAWLHRLAMAGINTYYTINWVETARLLTILYRNEQKPPEEHQTLQRVVLPRITTKEQDSFLRALLYLSHAYKLGVGEVKAKAITKRFYSIAHLLSVGVEDIAEVEGIGRKIASRMLMALGKEV
jgi:hypothetical protein